MNSVGIYANNLIGAALGKSEGFYDASGSSASSASTESFGTLGAYFIVIVLFTIVIIFANLYGAARLSWCYNTFYGVSGGEKYLWSLLCFLFSGIYYPFYAIFLDPVCGRVAQRGGRR
jgi:branched-subunit amino acid permease